MAAVSTFIKRMLSEHNEVGVRGHRGLLKGSKNMKHSCYSTGTADHGDTAIDFIGPGHQLKYLQGLSLSGLLIFKIQWRFGGGYICICRCMQRLGRNLRYSTVSFLLLKQSH